MIHANVDTGAVLDRIIAEYPGIHQALDARNRILKDAEWFRSSCEKQEEPIRKWEIKVREKAPRGRRWTTLLADGRKLLSSASNLYLTVLGSEQEALRHLKSAVDQLRELLAKPDLEFDPRVPEMLEQCARLREQEIRWIEEIIKLSSRIESLNGDATPEQVRPLLELRRRYLDQISMLKQTSRSLEERAFTTSASANGRSGSTGTEETGASVEEIIDVEFEDLDKKLRDLTEERDKALGSLAEMEARYEEEVERREELEKQIAGLQEQKEKAEERIEGLSREAAAETAGREKAQKQLAAAEEERDTVKETLAVALAKHAEEAAKWSEFEEIVARLETEKKKAEQEAARGETLLAKEVERREKLAGQVRELEAEKDKTLALLAETESRHVMDQLAWEEERTDLTSRIERARCARDEAEARRLEELRRLREAIRTLTGRVDEEIRGFEGGG